MVELECRMLSHTSLLSPFPFPVQRGGGGVEAGGQTGEHPTNLLPPLHEWAGPDIEGEAFNCTL